MLTTEWNIEDAIVVWKEEGREEGIDTSVMIIRALTENEPVEEISRRYNTPVSTVLKLQSAFSFMNSPE